ncbi:hypothetical protein GGF46_000787 [Coemansia sp. RSA 552]|nr:hypothetical protein GGF46_000787 [Coemansia sp. RSA 552]
MELNMKRGQIQAAKEQCAQSVYEIQRTALPGVSSQADSNAATHSEQQAPEHAQSSKWDRFADKPDDLHDPHDNGPDLDKHNRIVVGRVEKRIPAVHKGSKRTPKQKHGTEHAAPASSNRSALSQALAAMSRQTHQTKQQQSAVAAQSTPAPIPTSTDIPAIAAAKAPAAKSKQPGPAADKPQEPSRWDAFADDSDSD